MYTKRYVDEYGCAVTEEYKSWYNILAECMLSGPLCIIMGFVAIIGFPFIAVFTAGRANPGWRTGVVIESLFMGPMLILMGIINIVFSPLITIQYSIWPQCVSTEIECDN